MVNYHQKKVRVNYHHFGIMDNGYLPSIVERRRAIFTVYVSDIQGVDIRGNALDAMTNKKCYGIQKTTRRRTNSGIIQGIWSREGVYSRERESLNDRQNMMFLFTVCIVHFSSGAQQHGIFHIGIALKLEVNNSEIV